MGYQGLMTIASFEIVKELPDDSYGLIFGINTFFVLGFQTILTSVVNTALGIEAGPQFIIYAGFYLCICLMYAFTALFTLINNNKVEWGLFSNLPFSIVDNFRHESGVEFDISFRRATWRKDFLNGGQMVDGGDHDNDGDQGEYDR